MKKKFTIDFLEDLKKLFELYDAEINNEDLVAGYPILVVTDKDDISDVRLQEVSLPDLIIINAETIQNYIDYITPSNKKD